MTDTPETPSLMTFPCEFTIKVFGAASDEFETLVLSIIRKHAKELREDAIQTRNSGQGKYLALSITIQAESQSQLDAIYQELSSTPQVLMAL